MNILFLRGFNNYFNRIVKKYSALDDYIENSLDNIDLKNINFNPNDGVSTELIIGGPNQLENNAPLDWENIGTPDYCICYETSGTPAVNTIISRWFVLESERTRSGQYRLALKRDVVAEHFNTIITSPCFIEKGIVSNIDNPLLYNKESMTYNQIKKFEYPLKDATNCGWIVGYVPKNLPASGSYLSGGIDTTILLEGTPADYIDSENLPFRVNPSTPLIYKSLDRDMDIYTYVPVVVCDKDKVYSTRIYNRAQYWIRLGYREGSNITVTPTPSGNNSFTDSSFSAFIARNIIGDYESSEDLSISEAIYGSGSSNNGWYMRKATVGPGNDMTYANLSSNSSYIQKYVPMFYNEFLADGFKSNNPISLINTTNNVDTRAFIGAMTSNMRDYSSADFLSYNNKIIKYTDDKYYQLKITKSNDLYIEGFGQVGSLTVNSSYPNAIISSHTSQLTTVDNEFGSFLRSLSRKSTASLLENGAKHFESLLPMRTYTVVLTQISTETLHIDDRIADNRAHTYDNSADLFAIPYGPISCTSSGGNFQTDATKGLAMARAIASRYSTNCYDLQLVPYCPSQIIRDDIKENGSLNLNNYETQSYQIFTASSTPVGVVFWCTTSKGTFDIDLNVNPYASYQEAISEALIYKISNETEVCRVASPNFSGQFEFSVAKNKGVTKFNVDYTYKPYAPYIHINPDFKGLYGQDWDDARGLICGGDFSLNHITSYWQTYMNENKNFQQIFDRQIQNMDVNNSIAMEKQEFQATVGIITSAIGGTLGGAAAGATAGSVAGPWGAAIGGVVGAVGGGIGSGIASAYGAEKDKDWLQRQQSESRSYAIDMYGYQLGNIQAMPYSIKGSDALTNNNKIWPIVEIYQPTETEIELLKSKIEFNGMTIMAVGHLEDYMTSSDFEKVFLKGQLIRIDSEELNDDFHIADAIYQEINKGVYIPSGGL